MMLVPLPRPALRLAFSIQKRSFSLAVIRSQDTGLRDSQSTSRRIGYRGVPRTLEEMMGKLMASVESPPNPRLLKIAIVGVPNSGKSTLINKLMGWKVCSVSSKVHTTQVNARAVCNFNSTQLVFLDTPGLVTPEETRKHGLNRTLLTNAELSLEDADMMAVLHDVSNKYQRNALHPRVLRLLALYPTIPCILILNKIDVTKSKQYLLEITHILTDGVLSGKKSKLSGKEKEKLLSKEELLRKALSDGSDSDSTKNGSTPSAESELQGIARISARKVFQGKVKLGEHNVSEFIKDRKGWPKFEEVFMISALKNEGVSDLKNFLMASAYDAPWIFNSQVVTDQNPQEIALMTVREKFLDSFKNEIGYTLQFKIEHWELSESEMLYVTVHIGCRRKGLVRLLVGAYGTGVKRISQAAEQELRNIFRCEVRLRLSIVYDPEFKKIQKV